MCGIFFTKTKLENDSKYREGFNRIAHRGPDFNVLLKKNEFLFGFHRLAIVDLSENGNQPFINDNKVLVCNGEIYNYQTLKKEHEFDYKSNSDCEVLLPLIDAHGIEKACRMLDAEFAFIWANTSTGQVMAARDPIGIRPLFYGQNKEGEIAFASEAKALQGFCKDVQQFPPGHYYVDGNFYQYRSPYSQIEKEIEPSDAISGIKALLIKAVSKRLMGDAKIGFLLSGGLDSSLVSAIGAKLSNQKIRTFSIGTDTDAIDNMYAEKVAKYIGSEHTTVTFTRKEAINALDNVIRTLETYDTTTIRASVGMYLICEYIRKNTDIKVLLTGEVSDELFGYKYTDYAPTPQAFQEEARKRIKELAQYDVLRADRCIAAHALEARVPFGDLDFVDHVMSIPAEMKMNKTGVGKALLRKAFEGTGLLPDEILFREKAAFSDAVGHSMVDYLKEQAENFISDDLFTSMTFTSPAPRTKEEMMYRIIFESNYPERSGLIPGFWMPNADWDNCNVIDPSARVLPNYGKSGI